MTLTNMANTRSLAVADGRPLKRQQPRLGCLDGPFALGHPRCLALPFYRHFENGIENAFRCSCPQCDKSKAGIISSIAYYIILRTVTLPLRQLASTHERSLLLALPPAAPTSCASSATPAASPLSPRR